MSKKILGGRFQLEAKVGEGGMGSVYRAFDLVSSKTVAIKILKKELAESRHARKRFSREALAAGRLNHPNIVRVYKYVDDTKPYIVMEFVDGVSFRRYLRRDKPAISEILSMVTQLCGALEHAHINNVVHRDLKPDNLTVDRNGRIKILDFGLARMKIPEISNLTRAGSALGTCSYMAPEQASGMPADERSDLYSLGVILYEAVCGKTPFRADEPASVLYMHVHEDPRRPRDHNPDIPPIIEDLILRLLEKDPKKRPASANALRDQIAFIKRQLAQPTFTTTKSVGLDRTTQEFSQIEISKSDPSYEPVPGELVSVSATDIPSLNYLIKRHPKEEAINIVRELEELMDDCFKSHDGKIIEKKGSHYVTAFCGEDQTNRAVQSIHTLRTRVASFLNRYQFKTEPVLSAGVFGGTISVQQKGSSWENIAKHELKHGANRLEKISRTLPETTLVSEECIPKSHRVEPYRSLFVRGRREPIRVFRVLDGS